MRYLLPALALLLVGCAPVVATAADAPVVAFRPDLLPVPYDGARVVILGDSTIGEPAAVLALHNAPPCEVVYGAAAGFGGPETFMRYVRDVIPVEPTAVLVQFTAAHLFYRRPEVAADTLAVYVREMVRAADDAGHALIFLSPPVSVDEPVAQIGLAWGSVTRQEHAALLDELAAVIADNGGAVVDAPDMFGADDFSNTTHLNEQGRDSYAAWIQETIINDFCSGREQ